MSHNRAPVQSFLERCEWAIKDANAFLETTLRQNMFSHISATEQTNRIEGVARIFANNEGRAHNTHIQYQQCKDSGLNVTRLEDDAKLQDLVLTLHHCYMHSLSNTPAFKIVENHLGRAMVKQQLMQVVQSSIPAGSAGPA